MYSFFEKVAIGVLVGIILKIIFINSVGVERFYFLNDVEEPLIVMCCTDLRKRSMSICLSSVA